MNKLYTINHKNFTTCYDFDVKFKDFLSHLVSVNVSSYTKFAGNCDFKIDNLVEFKEVFSSFFRKWLIEFFSFKAAYDIQNIDSFISERKTTDHRFDELFANYNFLKKLDSATDAFYVYDITEEGKYDEIIKNKPLLKTSQ